VVNFANELYIAVFCALYIAQNEYKIIVSNEGKEMRYQVAPKTFRQT